MPESKALEEIKVRLEIQTAVKQELSGMLKQNARRITINTIITAVCAKLILIVFILYFTRPTKVDVLTFKAIQEERMALKHEREANRVERERLKQERDALLRMQMRKNGY